MLAALGRENRAQRPNDGYVYMVGDGEFVKIGYAESTPVRERINIVRCGSPRPVQVLAVFPAESIEEKILHAYFHDEHSHHEWFHLSERLRAFAEYAGIQVPFEEMPMWLRAQRRGKA